MMHVPHALTKRHTNETGCQSEVALNSFFVAELVTPLLIEGSYSDLSQIHSFDGGNSSIVVEGCETGATDACCRMNQTDPHEPQNARNAKSENRKTMNKHETI